MFRSDPKLGRPGSRKTTSPSCPDPAQRAAAGPGCQDQRNEGRGEASARIEAAQASLVLAVRRMEKDDRHVAESSKDEEPEGDEEAAGRGIDLQELAGHHGIRRLCGRNLGPAGWKVRVPAVADAGEATRLARKRWTAKATGRARPASHWERLGHRRSRFPLAKYSPSPVATGNSARPIDTRPLTRSRPAFRPSRMCTGFSSGIPMLLARRQGSRRQARWFGAGCRE